MSSALGEWPARGPRTLASAGAGERGQRQSGERQGQHEAAEVFRGAKARAF